jgi:ABC-type transport system substrate-binding protein
MWFRKACFHLYNQEEIVASIYGYIVTPVQSLVPPAQGGWVNPAVSKPAYSRTLAQQVLEDHGYTFDSGINNWRMPGGDPIPEITLWTPTYEVAPTSAEHGARFIQECNDFGLTSMVHEPREFSPYMDDVDLGDFDMYMVFWSLGRFPDHLETMCHSDHDVAIHPADYNKPGCNDPTLDAAVRTIITSLDHEEKLIAAYDAQDILYNDAYPGAAYSYMQLYSRIYFNAFHPDLRGIVNSPGYGSNNGWTWSNIRWAPGTERYHEEYTNMTVIDWCWGEEPELLNPCSSSTVYAWDLMTPTLDGPIAVNPYTHEDMPWMCTDWDVDVIPDGGGPGVDWMSVTFYLNETCTWQDGRGFIADDAVFSWLFLRDWLVPRYLGLTQWLEDAEALDTYTARATLNTTSQFLVYDLAGTMALLPPQIWDRAWANLNAIMTYAPANIDYGTDMAPGYTAGVGPWDTLWASHADPPMRNLFGTGPFVFKFYDSGTQSAELWQNHNFFKYTDEIFTMKVEMFHRVGDVNRDGYIDVFDLAALGAAYGQRIGWPGYNPDADVNSDGICDGRDLALITWHWGEQREYPVP